MLGGYRGLDVGVGVGVDIDVGVGVSLGFGGQIGQVNMSKGRILSHIDDRKL